MKTIQIIKLLILSCIAVCPVIAHEYCECPEWAQFRELSPGRWDLYREIHAEKLSRLGVDIAGKSEALVDSFDQETFGKVQDAYYRRTSSHLYDNESNSLPDINHNNGVNPYEISDPSRTIAGLSILAGSLIELMVMNADRDTFLKHPGLMKGWTAVGFGFMAFGGFTLTLHF